MEAVLIGLGFLAVIVLFVWCERDRANSETKEDAELRESIKHLPFDTQVRILSAHYRLRAERDLF